jgi:polyhydroxyalkanoate synthesis regulator phasin
VSGAGSGAVPGRMEEPDSDRSAVDRAERLALAGVGAIALTAERIDALANALAERGSIQRDEARETITELTTRWRGESVRLGERAGAGLAGVFREVGLVTREEFDELELRVAQLEHRLRLLEREPGSTAPRLP